MKALVLARSLVVALLVSMACSQHSHAIFGIFSKDKDRLPTKAEVARHDAAAAKLFAAGEIAASKSKGRKALGYYEKIAKKYYFSKHAPEALFRSAELSKASGEPLDAFDYYQQLIDRHQSSPRYQSSVEQQFNIAVESLTEKKRALLGVVPRKVSHDKVIVMFQSVIRNAPASLYAADSYYYVGRIYEAKKDSEKAVLAFQKVVDDFPKSEKAPKAQLRIAEIFDTTARRPDNPTNLRQSREAYEDFITNFPQHQNAGDAYAQLNAISEKEATKSLKIANYYLSQGNTKAAAIYFKDALGSNNAALKQQARNGLSTVSQSDPEAMDLAKIDPSDTQTPAEELLKNQKNYLGPPAPDLAATALKKKQRTPLVPSKVMPEAIPSALPEPALPQSGGVDVESLVPVPPSPEEILEVDASFSPETDIDSLLPPVPPADE
jgi:outer membrane protein assembly factor BamD (BamD/ComL family)